MQADSFFGDRINKGLVVVNQEHSRLLFFQQLDQLVLVEKVQVVGRFIPKIEAGLLRQGLGQGHPLLLPLAHLLNLLLKGFSLQA